MLDKGFIREIVEKEIEETSLFLVDLTIRPDNKIVVEIDNDNGVSIED